MNNVLITGANRGIGLALVKLYAQRGDSVIACCREPSRAEHLYAPEIANTVTVLPLDVGSPQSVAELARRLSNATVDILINNAGIIGQPIERQTATSMDFPLWEEILRINTLGPARVVQALLPQLKRSKQSKGVAKVMNVTSDLGALSNDSPIFYGYSASKAALNKYMRLTAIELKQQGIAVGLVHPGWVHTDMGGPSAPVAPETSAAGIIKLIDKLHLDNAGSFWQWDGALHEW